MKRVDAEQEIKEKYGITVMQGTACLIQKDCLVPIPKIFGAMVRMRLKLAKLAERQLAGMRGA